ncbi:hypothetical protein PSPO01_16419, partial [Paraphaeosphaeria sporulosa]
YNDFIGWYTQLQARCVAYNLWDKVNPDLVTPLIMQLVAIRAPVIANYAPAANIEILVRQSELSTAGQKAFKEDLEYYKICHEQYKSDRHEYERE